jgi:hypothetical protein
MLEPIGSPKLNEFIYLFLDEGGNFDFNAAGTKYFSLTCVTMKRPFGFHF